MPNMSDDELNNLFDENMKGAGTEPTTGKLGALGAGALSGLTSSISGNVGPVADYSQRAFEEHPGYYGAGYAGGTGAQIAATGPLMKLGATALGKVGQAGKVGMDMANRTRQVQGAKDAVGELTAPISKGLAKGKDWWNRETGAVMNGQNYSRPPPGPGLMEQVKTGLAKYPKTTTGAVQAASAGTRIGMQGDEPIQQADFEMLQKYLGDGRVADSEEDKRRKAMNLQSTPEGRAQTNGDSKS